MERPPNAYGMRKPSLNSILQSLSMLTHSSLDFQWRHLGLACPALASHRHLHKKATGESAKMGKKRKEVCFWLLHTWLWARKVYKQSLKAETLKGRVWEVLQRGASKVEAACWAGWTCVLSLHLIIRKELTLPTELQSSFGCFLWKIPFRQHQTSKPLHALAKDRVPSFPVVIYFCFPCLVTHVLECSLNLTSLVGFGRKMFCTFWDQAPEHLLVESPLTVKVTEEKKKNVLKLHDGCVAAEHNLQCKSSSSA